MTAKLSVVKVHIDNSYIFVMFKKLCAEKSTKHETWHGTLLITFSSRDVQTNEQQT